MTWKIVLSEPAADQVRGIKARRVREKLVARTRKLQESPEKQGKGLVGDLSEYRSVRAVGQRYRIIYKVENDVVRVFVVALGLRKDGDKKDIYSLARRLVRLGLVE
jgi:mRNA interferase RelE/StbE